MWRTTRASYAYPMCGIVCFYWVSVTRPTQQDLYYAHRVDNDSICIDDEQIKNTSLITLCYALCLTLKLQIFGISMRRCPTSQNAQSKNSPKNVLQDKSQAKEEIKDEAAQEDM
jgi:hypothetical protein